jgi:two-component system, LuxR family, response regulator FixJ
MAARDWSTRESAAPEKHPAGGREMLAEDETRASIEPFGLKILEKYVQVPILHKPVVVYTILMRTLPESLAEPGLMKTEPTVFVVDDDQGIRESLCWLIESVGLNVETFASATEFLDGYDPKKAGCLVLDVRMPGTSGLDLQDELLTKENTLPVIIITGHGDVPMAVRAMKAGAVDFIEKPFNDQVLLDRIQHAIAANAEARETEARRADVMRRLDVLTPREHEVLKMLVAGKRNREIAEELGVSQKTIEVHRANVMSKMEADRLADVVHMAMLAGIRRMTQ